MSKQLIETKEQLKKLINRKNNILTEKEYKEFCDNFNDNYDYSSITDMSFCFRYSIDIKTIPLLDTSNVTNMSYMFEECTNLETIPHLDTSKVTNMNNMFRYCNNLKKIPHLDTSNVTSMIQMFRGCYELKRIPKLNYTQVSDVFLMFKNCKNLRKKIHHHIFNEKIGGLKTMYDGCKFLEKIEEHQNQKIENKKLKEITKYNKYDMLSL